MHTRSIDRDLTAEGYRFYPLPASPFLFDVVKPAGTVYRVDLVAGSCTCKAGQRGVCCCHRREAAKRAAVANAPRFKSREEFVKTRALDFD